MTAKTITVPVSPDHWPLLQAEWPMTEREWAQMLHVLDTMRPNLVEPYGQTLERLAPGVVASAYEEAFNHGGLGGRSDTTPRSQTTAGVHNCAPCCFPTEGTQDGK